MMEENFWNHINLGHGILIERFVAEYVVHTNPLGLAVQYRIYDDKEKVFHAYSNIKFINAVDSTFIFPSGKGMSQMSALKDAISQICSIVQEMTEIPVEGKNFFYCNNHEF
ncbi:MAG: hypothetical protein ACRC2T_20480 [Thermoguttaceae bacterium]